MNTHSTTLIDPSAQLGKNVSLGRFVTIGPNVRIDDGCVIEDFCTLGHPLTGATEKHPKLHLGKDSLVRSHSILYSGSTFGERFMTGHRATIREFSSFGRNCSVGTLGDIQGHVSIGDYCRFHSNVHIGQKTRIGNYVWVYPYVIFTNDPLPPSNSLVGCTVEDFAQICTASVLLPGVTVAEHAVVGAGSVVTRSVAAYSLAVGNPAKHRKDVRELRDASLGGAQAYPWPLRFSRGMPWSEIGFEAWSASGKPTRR